jgi:hypothetical protein
MAFITNGLIGTNLTRTTAGTTTDGENAEIQLGTTALGTDGTEWVYVQAGAAISQYHAVGIDENFQAAPLTNTVAATSHKVGFAQVAFSDNDFGWVATRGSNISVKTRASCAADVLLYSTASSGRLDDTVGGSGIAVTGVVLVVAASTSASAGSTVREVLATFPTLVEP